GEAPPGPAPGRRPPLDAGLLPDGQCGHDDGDLPDRRHPAAADELRRDDHRDLDGGPGAVAECETPTFDTVLLIGPPRGGVRVFNLLTAGGSNGLRWTA